MTIVLSEKQAAEYRKLKVEAEAAVARRAHKIRHAIEEQQQHDRIRNSNWVGDIDTGHLRGGADKTNS